MKKELGSEANILLKLTNPILLIDRKSYIIIDCNQSFVQMLGYINKAELEGKCIEDISSKFQAGGMESARLISNLFERAKNNDVNIHSWFFKTVNDYEKICLLSFSDFEENNTIACLIIDLSVLRNTEEALKKSHAMLLTILNNSTDLIWSVDNQFRLIELNKAAKQTTLQIFKREITSGTDLLKVLPSEISETWKERFQRALSGECFMETDEMKLEEGIIHIQTIFSPIMIDNVAIGVLCFSKNISQEKINESTIILSNERLQIYKQLSQYHATNLQDFFSFLIFTVLNITLSETGLLFIHNSDDESFTLLYKSIPINKEIELVGIDKRYSLEELGFIGEIINQGRPLILNEKSDINLTSINISLHKLIKQINKAIFIPVFENGKLVCLCCLLNKSNDYTSQDLINLTDIFDSAWQIARSIEYKYDLYISKENAEMLNQELHKEVEARIKIESELEIARKKAESSNLSKSTFLANMSHEIRTPMNAIIGFTEILDEKVKDTELKSYIESIKNSSKSLLTLINDVLDLSKVEAGKLELKNSFFDVISLFQEIGAIFSIRIKEKGLDFKMDIQNDFPVSIYLDEIRLRQILINLVGNAIKYTNSGSITLKAYFNTSGAQNNTDNSYHVNLFIEIIDTGIGISPDFQSQLFNSFAQQDPAKLTGTGLGLSICKNLIGLMNGEIHVNSIEGKGTTFIISLRNTLVSNERITEVKAIRLNPRLIRFKPSQILLVEDNEDNQKYFKSALSKEDIEIQTANNGKEALSTIKKFLPNVIITDLKMPVMDGYQLIATLKSDARYKDIPVIASTAAIMVDDKKRIIKSKFDGILIKPYNITDLYLTLSSFLKYDKLNENSIIPEPSPNVRTIKNQQELISKLSGFRSKWDEFKEQQPLNEVKIFAVEVSKLGEEHDCTLLIEYGSNLLNAANTFDVDKILKNINIFPNLINKIKELDV